MRREYTRSNLRRKDLALDPRDQFFHWFQEAEQCMLEPNAMALATSSAQGKPSSRMVLFQRWDKDGLLFFTNYLSRKARELQENPHAAATFYWDQLEKQIRLEGKVEKASAEVSDHYFAERPRGSQLSSWASHQDEPITKRSLLEESYHTYTQKYEGQPVPRPPYWGGFRLKPNRVEFWQGRADRLHDRFLYLKENSSWTIQRLSP